jgi:hypothetical protein
LGIPEIIEGHVKTVKKVGSSLFSVGGQGSEGWHFELEFPCLEIGHDPEGID